MSLPALIIVDDDDDDAPPVKPPLSKQHSQGDGPHRRHSEKVELTNKSADVNKVKKAQKPQTSNDVSKAKPTRAKAEKTVNTNAVSKQSFGRKSKEVKEDKIASSSVSSLQDLKPSTVGSLSETVKKGLTNGLEKPGKLWRSCNGNKPVELDIDPQLSGDESSVGPRTSSTTTPNTMTPTTTPATPTTPTNLTSDSLAFLRDSECGIERLM